MATYGKQKLLPQEVKKRNNLIYILPIVMFIFMIIIGVGAFVTFQALNKNIMKNNKQVERLQKQLNSFQESQFKTRTILNEDFDALNKQFKVILRGLEEIKGIYGKERVLFSEGISRNEKTIEQINEGILAMNLEIKNQRDNFKFSPEDIIGNLRKEFANDFENLMYFQNETRRDLTKLLYNLNNQTYEAIENLTHYYTEKQQYDNYLTMAMKNFLSLNDSLQYYNNSLNSSESYYYPNMTTERSYEINYTTQRQNTTYNGSDVVFPITLPIFKEIQVNNETGPVEPEYFCCEDDLIDLMNHTESQTNRSNFSGLVLKKAGEIREFVNDAYNKAFEKLRNSFKSKSEVPEEENKEEKIEKEEVKENNRKNQIVKEGINAMRKYVGGVFGSLVEKLNSRKQQENFTIEANGTQPFRNTSFIEQETQNYTNSSIDDRQKYSQEIEMVVLKMMNITSEIKERKDMKEEEFEYEKQKVLSFEHMFDYLEYLLRKYSEIEENLTSLKEWKKNYGLCRDVYEGIRSALVKEENQLQQKMPQKQFFKRIQKFLPRLQRVKGFPGF